MLPKAKIKKISKEEFIKIADKVKKSLQEERKFLEEKKLSYANYISSRTSNFT